MATALIVQGGWDGHEPGPISQLLAGWLREAGFTVEVADTLDAFADEAKLKQLDLLVPIWTMGNIKPEQLNPLLNAVRGGVGIAGLHGGMGDAFRNETEYQFMVGGQWVAHPGGIVTYTVNIRETSSPIMEGVTDFEITSEQYYMHVDPANEVLATTCFAFNNAVMPVVWTKHYGQGRVFYCSAGHVAKDLAIPQLRRILTRGMLWAARAL
ncbi:MAG: ThuA domain-containing protein [Armatimonadetes bacterium]|jgi:type 1 glutamine amidotransferase|nr:ThuA domain-containing protein [Armatimonadota bacterium]